MCKSEADVVDLLLSCNDKDYCLFALFPFTQSFLRHHSSPAIRSAPDHSSELCQIGLAWVRPPLFSTFTGPLVFLSPRLTTRKGSSHGICN